MRKILIATCLVVSAVACLAQTPAQVATVTSSAPFTLRGAAVTPGQGVPMWPVLAGDTLKAGSALTIVTFPDGSVLTLDPGAQAKVDLVGGKPQFQLLSGVARYSLKSTSSVDLLAANQTVTPKNTVGTMTVGGNQNAAAGGFWTAGHTAAVIVGAGAAAGAGVGISAATHGGSSVSPSH
jgi:hypothetical protein